MKVQKNTSYPKEKINILLLENISKEAAGIFNDHGYVNVKRVSGAMSEEELMKEIGKVHILGIRSKTVVTKKVLEQGKMLQAIGCFCIGVNQVDLLSATRLGIAVFNAPYSNTRSVAELVIGASIMLMRRIPDKNTAAHQGIWLKDANGAHELRGKTMGLVGYGNIGSQVSVLAESLGMKVIYFDVETKLPLGNATDAKTMKELLNKSDIVSLHVPEQESTRNLIHKNNLKHCKKGAIIINYARGTVVDLDALKQSIVKGDIGGAAIDVFPVEPEKNGSDFSSPMIGLNNVILTPHVGGSTEEAQKNIGVDVAHKLLQFLEKGISTGSHTVPVIALPSQDGAHRILHIHKNVPGVLGNINSVLSKNKINILGQYLKTNDEIGYVVLDLDKSISKQAIDILKQVQHSIRVRILY